jgi:hypothetical protein
MKRALIPLFLVAVAIVVACSDDTSQSQPKVFNITLSPPEQDVAVCRAGVNATGTAKVRSRATTPR